jgi:hypothetical protein
MEFEIGEATFNRRGPRSWEEIRVGGGTSLRRSYGREVFVSQGIASLPQAYVLGVAILRRIVDYQRDAERVMECKSRRGQLHYSARRSRRVGQGEVGVETVGTLSTREFDRGEAYLVGQEADERASGSSGIQRQDLTQA